MKHIKLFENFQKEDPINGGCFDMLSTDDINRIVNNDNLDDAMKMAQDIIGQTDGGVCGIYWSEFDDDHGDQYEEWESSSKDERLYHLKKYLELEDSYKEMSK